MCEKLFQSFLYPSFSIRGLRRFVVQIKNKYL